VCVIREGAGLLAANRGELGPALGHDLVLISRLVVVSGNGNVGHG
jgi:hypothetical protein